jgi:hypothetical protein
LPSPEVATGAPSDRWENALWLFLTTRVWVSLEVSPRRTMNKPRLGMDSRQCRLLPTGGTDTASRRNSRAARDGFSYSPRPPAASRCRGTAAVGEPGWGNMLQEVREMRLERVHQMPALPFGINPVRLPQGQRLALTDDDQPRGRLALTDDDIDQGHAWP